MTSRASFQDRIPSIEKLQLQLRWQRPAVIWLLLGLSAAQFLQRMMNGWKRVAAHLKAARYHTKGTPDSPPTPTPDHLKWFKPLVRDLTFLDPVVRIGTQGIFLGVAFLKFQFASDTMEEYAEKHFKVLEKKTKVEKEKVQLLKEILATYQDLDFFLKMWRKSLEDSHGKVDASAGPLKSQDPKN